MLNLLDQRKMDSLTKLFISFGLATKPTLATFHNLFVDNLFEDNLLVHNLDVDNLFLNDLKRIPPVVVYDVYNLFKDNIVQK